MRRSSVSLCLAVLLGSLVALVRPVAAHVGGLTDTTVSAPVPTWLTVLTGGAIVGVSFLLTSVVTDHDLIRGVAGAHIRLPGLATLRRWGRRAFQLLGLGALAFIVVTGMVGPTTPTENAAILLVWAAWWGGFTMTVYLLGNSWPAVDPVRTLAGLIPSAGRFSYPDRLGAWPSVAGLLGLVYFEVVMPVASAPRFLTVVVLAYVLVGLLGAWAFGRATWFGTIDPVARVFRVYGRFAPIQRTADGFELRLPGNTLIDDATSHPLARGSSGGDASEDAGSGRATPINEAGQTAFIVALLWVTTYDGLVATPLWRAFATPIVGVGIPPLVLYLVAILAGFALFLALYRLATRRGRDAAETYVSARFFQDWFAPALVPIAAGYHIAHFFGYFLSLSPALLAVLGSPLAPPTELLVIVLPEWWGSIQLLFVLVGHLIAVWVAHALAFELFPGILTPLRSQYPLVLAMIVYTMISAWIVTQPFGAPPFV